MSNIPGLNLENLFLVFLSYFLIFLVDRKTRSDSPGLLIGILTFHHIVAYLYAFVISTPPNEVDPVGFMYLASDCANSGYCGYFGPHLYGNYLAKVLSLGDSVYFVFLLNIIFFVVSLYFFIEISKILFLNGNRKVIIFLYSMWPSVVYFTTLNYREPFELFLLVAGVYYGLSGSKSGDLLKMLASMILLFIMGIFHMKGLTFLSPVLFVILMGYKFSFKISLVAKKAGLLIIMLVAVYLSQDMYAGFLNDISQNKSVQQSLVKDNRSESTDNVVKPVEIVKEIKLSGNRLLFENNKDSWLASKNYSDAEPGLIDKLMRKVTFYRASLTWVVIPRTVFIGNIEDSSIFLFIVTYFLVYLEYLFAPFIFQVNSYLSLLAYLESVLRLVLFASALVLVKRSPQVRLLFLIYLAITAMWAIGVVSFGASIRHHIQTNWILVLLGVPAISEYIHRKFRQEK
ncbi:hypothetical protein BMS3Abin11_02067 [bacterium BMS3Abin11]|nr:hypothetical protein BMS3Abin11_02067 [bacterium BMS3Abin11]